MIREVQCDCTVPASARLIYFCSTFFSSHRASPQPARLKILLFILPSGGYHLLFGA